MTIAVREAPAVAAALERTREATLQLLEPLDDELLLAQVSPIMSPLVWDLAHIGWFEELWLVRGVAEGGPSLEGFDDLYDAFRHDREERSSLAILKPADARAYLETVRRQALTVLEAEPRDAYVYSLVMQHELQHQETMLQTLQLSGFAYATPAHDDLRPAPEPEDVLVPAGPFMLGTNDRSWAYDNERPAHLVEVPAFRLERFPVTNERFAEFVEDGGYREQRYWSDDGWRWLRAERVEAPLYWERGPHRLAAAALRTPRACAAGGTGHARLVLRGRSARGLGRQTAADGSGVGESGAGGGARGRRDARARVVRTVAGGTARNELGRVRLRAG